MATAAPDFESFLETASSTEAVPVTSTAGPQAAERPTIFDFSDRSRPERPRTSVLGWISLVFAVVIPPLGLVLSIVARSIALRRHGWRTRAVSIATGISLGLTMVLAIGAFILGMFATEAAGVDEIVAESAPFCAALAETPGVLDSAGYAWPTGGDSVRGSIAAMTEYRDRWVQLAGIAPAGIESGVSGIADTAAAIVANAESSQSIDPQRALDQITVATNASGIPAYVDTYCR